MDDSVPDVRADVSASDGVADSAAVQVMYDVLGNERHKAVCRLREWRPDEDGMPHRELWEAVMGEKLPTVPLKGDAELDIILRDRLIHLLGEDEPNFTEIAETIKSGDECDGELMENGENHKIATITDELRNLRPVSKVIYRGIELVTDHNSIIAIKQRKLIAIADRIDEQAKQLERQRNELQVKLEEADAAIANYREREKSFAESERLRDELQKRLDEMREQREHWADEATKMYRLFFSHDEYCVPDSPSEMVTVAVRTLQEKCSALQAKLDAIREALDG